MIPEIFSTDSAWPYSKAKTAVLAAASAVIREEGPRAATLKNIATRAGITEPAIFRHFDGVDGLFGGLFSAFERVYELSAEALTSDGKGLAKLREAGSAIIANIAACQDFAYVLIYARHVFRGYPELKAKVLERDSKDQAAILARVAEGVKSGEIRSDIDPVSIATAFMGAIESTTTLWIESGFGFDIVAAFADRLDDFERSVATKSQAKSRDAKASSRERAAAYFPLKPAKNRGAAAKKAAAKAKAKTPAKKAKPKASAAKPKKATPKGK
jgi:AcrR family transcriptional regulator